jgi:uncharacterized protein DUF2806
VSDEKGKPGASGPLIEVSGINLKGWEKPVEKLIETLGSGAGILYEPRAIRERAKATRDAAITLAKAEQNILDLRQRGEHRRQDLEDRRQRNIESIAGQTIKELPDRVADEPVDPDWVYQFVNHCQDVGNDKMQRIWAKILSGEITKPGSFSLRCLRIVADLTGDDARRFTNLCSFVWSQPGVPEDTYSAVIFKQLDVSEKRVSFNDLLLLEHAALVRIENIHGSYTVTVSPETEISYFGKRFQIAGVDESVSTNGLPVGQVILTTVGAELVPIAGGEADDVYCRSVLDYWKGKIPNHGDGRIVTLDIQK